MQRVRHMLILSAVLLAAFALLSHPTALKAQAPPPVAVQRAAVSRLATTPTPVPTRVVPQTTVPIGQGTRQVLMIMGAVLMGSLLIGGGIYLRRRWISGGW